MSGPDNMKAAAFWILLIYLFVLPNFCRWQQKHNIVVRKQEILCDTFLISQILKTVGGMSEEGHLKNSLNAVFVASPKFTSTQHTQRLSFFLSFF